MRKPLFPVHSEKVCNRTIIGPLKLRSKIAARQLPVLPVIMQALAAFMLPAAGFIRAGTERFVFFHDAFHNDPPDCMLCHFRKYTAESFVSCLERDILESGSSRHLCIRRTQ